nr:helix-turn-helix domain-containing protein [uncultured Draconibacterium sp.]
MKQVLHIKNMVCNRCIKVVKEELEKLDIQVETIELGKVGISENLDIDQTEKVRSVLDENGFELMDNKKSQLIDRIKTIIIEKTHYSNNEKEPVNFSEMIVGEVGHDYSYLSKLFSSVEGITIEKYIINQKIEKVKELLVYGELTLNEISYQLGYSSVQHLSNQFKKVTGLTPSHFKNLKENKRKPLDEV